MTELRRNVNFVAFCIIIVVFISDLSVTTAKKCGTCTCNLVTNFPTTSTQVQSVLYINCSDSFVDNHLQLPDKESYAEYKITEVHAEFQRNKIGEIQKFQFKNLATLNLAHNEIRAIVDGAFSRLPMLKDLDLSFNKLNILEMNVFTGLTKLERLNLFDTRIKKLDGNVFGELSSLKELELGHNFLVGELDKDLFSFLINLEKLSINENGFTGIDTDSFSNLRLLKNLDISGNSLEKIDDDIFITLKELNVLDLSRNKLVSLPEGIFRNLNKLVVLDLSHNALTKLDKSLEFSRSLRIVKVGNNQLTDLDFLQQDFDEMQQVHAENNELKNLEFVKAFSKIQVLNVSTNSISDIALQQYVKLHTLDLSNNTFQYVPALLTAQYLPSLTTLRLDMNPIVELHFPVTSAVFQNLSYVSVSNMPELKVLTAEAFASLRGKDPSRRENIEQAVADKEGGVMKKRQVAENSFEKFVNDEDDEEEVEKEPEVVKEEPDVVKEEPEVVEKEQTEFLDGLEDPVKESLEEDEEKESQEKPRAETDTGNGEDEEKPKAANESENDDVVVVTNITLKEDTIEKTSVQNTDTSKVLPDLVAKQSGKNLETSEKTPVVQESEETKQEEVKKEGMNVDVLEEKKVVANVRTMQIGNLRSEPVPAKQQVDGDMININGDEENAMMKEVKCPQGKLVLRIRDNKNLVKIQEDTFKGIDICELDLSHNSLSTVPETIVDWSAVPSIDIQGNPWDCSCQLQWLLDIIVPKVYVRQPQLLYELRCGAPPMLRDRRFVHFYNWTEPAFCSVHKEQMKIIPVESEEDTGIVLKLGGSSGMFVIVGVACGLVVLMVGVGVYLQRRVTLKRRKRNRRI